MATLSGKKRSTHEEDDEYTPSSKKKVRFERARHSRGGAGSSANAEEDTEDEDSLGDLSQVASQVLQEGDAAKRVSIPLHCVWSFLAHLKCVNLITHVLDFPSPIGRLRLGS